MSHHNQQQQQQQQHQMDEFGRTQTMPKLKPNQVAVVTESPPHPQQILVKAAAEKGSPVVVVEDSSEQPAAGRVNVFEIEARNLCYRTPRSRRHILLDSSCCTTTSSSSSSSSRGRSSSSSSSSSSKEEACSSAMMGRSKEFILKDVSCVAKAGEILAVAGPSGAGKSTLLEVLAGRIRPSSPAQSILVNGRPMNVSAFRRVSGFIPQADALFPLLTVRETLHFSARLRLGRSVSAGEKEKRVEELLRELKLEHVAETRVGNEESRGVSGGERRRVSIGVDVIHDPAVLFLDEPTSGLDSASALHVIQMLHAMAAKSRCRRTIVLSIHQPSYRIIQHISSFLLLANGSVVHHGSLQSLHLCLLHSGHHIPPQVNVLEYAIEALSSSEPHDDDNATTTKKPNAMATPITTDIPIITSDNHNHTTAMGPWDGESFNKANNGHVMQYVTSNNQPMPMPMEPCYANSMLVEASILSQRFSRNIFRTHELFTARTLQAVIGGLAMGSIYMNAGGGEEGVQKRLGFFAFTLTYLLSSTVEALPIFLQERSVVVAETSRGAYRVSSYMLANVAVFMPFLMLVAILYSIPVYFLIGLSPTAWGFIFFVWVVWMVLMMANSFVAFFGALVPDYIMGNSLISGCMGAFFLFSGYFISPQDMPPYWRFMHYLSLFKYPLDALLINEYTSSPSLCFGPLLPSPSPSPSSAVVCSLTGPHILEQLHVSPSSKWPNIAIMLSFILAYRLLCYLVLSFKVSRRTT